MSGFYDGNDGQRTYRFALAALDTAAIFGRIQGPAGKVGRLTGVEWVVINELTTNPTVLTFDHAVALPLLPTVSVAAAAAALGGSATEAELKAGAEFLADTIVECTSNGGAAAGDADVNITIQWY